jgi:arylsulfatase A-like enzyme
MPPIKRRTFLKGTGAAMASAAVTSVLHHSAVSLTRPNIVFILADDMGYGDVNFLNGNSKIPTPNIDRIGREGRYFTDAHSPSALCTPTRYGVLAGQYCWRTRITRGVCWGYSKHLISPERMTVASLLQSQGYNTACVGKWHLGMDMQTRQGGIIQDTHSTVDTRAYNADIDWNAPILNGPTTVGFDHFYGISASLDMYPYIWIQDDQFVGECTTTQDLLFITRDYRPERYADNTGPAHKDFVAEEVMPIITQRTVDWIDQQNQDTPFFMCMSLTAPHIPIVPSAPYRGLSELGAYGDFCIEVDESIGKVLDVLDQKGVADNTLVIFSADNGCAPYIGVEEMNEKGHFPSYVFRGYKSDIFEGGHRIPFLARWPDRIEAGTRSDETICLTDMLKTCAAINGVGVPSNAGEDSYNILPALVGDKFVAPIREATVATAGNGTFSVRQGRWKLNLTGSTGGYGNISQKEVVAQGLPLIQLYDLENDVGETNNVYAEYPDVVNRLNALLESYKVRGRSTPA